MVGDAGVEPRDVCGAGHHVAVGYHGLVVDEEGSVSDDDSIMADNVRIIYPTIW